MENNDETRYLYSVYPKKIIKKLPSSVDIAPIRVPKSLYLTKEDVIECLKVATVYRRFANDGKVERVFLSNVNRLHNKNFMTEKEYGHADSLAPTVVEEAPVVKEEENVMVTIEEKPEEVAVVEEVVEEQPIVEEPVVEQQPIVEEVVEDTVVEEQEFNDTVAVEEEQVTEEATEEVVESVEEEQPTTDEDQQQHGDTNNHKKHNYNQFQYNKKKNKQ